MTLKALFGLAAVRAKKAENEPKLPNIASYANGR